MTQEWYPALMSQTSFRQEIAYRVQAKRFLWSALCCPNSAPSGDNFSFLGFCCLHHEGRAKQKCSGPQNFLRKVNISFMLVSCSITCSATSVALEPSLLSAPAAVSNARAAQLLGSGEFNLGHASVFRWCEISNQYHLSSFSHLFDG